MLTVHHLGKSQSERIVWLCEELGLHYDLWYFYEVQLPEGARVERPAWYAALELRDARGMAASEYARGHEDVVARYFRF